MYSLLSDDLWWLLIGNSLLDALFLIWLFPSLVILKVSAVSYIANWLLFLIKIVFMKIVYSLKRDHEMFTITEHFKPSLLTVFVNNSLTKYNI